MATSERIAAEPFEAQRTIVPLLGVVTLMYVSLGAILGFVQGGVAPVLRAQGMDLSALRWAYALFVPFGVAFLWAPWIDRWRWPWLGKRTGWIVSMQAVAVAAVVIAAVLTPDRGAWALLLTMGLVATSCSATVDLALDALTVERIPDEHRTAAAAAKMGGISAGTVLGGGVLVAIYPQIGWTGSLLVIAALMVLSGILAFTLVNADHSVVHQTQQQRATLRETLRKPDMPKRLVGLTLLVCGLLALINFNRLMLVDMGVSLERIGSVLGIVAPIANAFACLLMAVLVRTISARRLAWMAGLFCLAGAGTVLLGYMNSAAQIVILGAVMAGAGASALYVVLGSLILKWAEGAQPATDYALLYGLGRLIATVSLMALPGVIQAVGWTWFQMMLIATFAMVLPLFMRLFPR